jgi:hypothetical protein
MKKGTEDKGIDNLITSEPEEGTHQQNGNSGPGDWKELLEREKLELEIARIEAETAELKKPFYKRQAYLQFSIPAIISLLAVLASLYFGVLDRNIKEKQEEVRELTASINSTKDKARQEATDLHEQNESAVAQLKELNTQIASYQAQSEKEKTDKEQFENTNRRLQGEQSRLQERLNQLKDKRDENKEVVDGLRFEYVKLNTELTKANSAVRMAALGEPLKELLTFREEGKPAKSNESTLVDGIGGGSRIITRLFQSNQRYRNDYEDYFRAALEKNGEIRKKLRISALLYKLVDSAEWKNKSEELTQEAVSGAIKELKEKPGEFNLRVFTDMRAIENYKLLDTALSFLHEEMNELEAGDIRNIFSRLDIPYNLIKKNPIFYRFLNAGLVLIYKSDGRTQLDGLNFILKLAGGGARAVFLGNLVSDKRISESRVTYVLEAPTREYIPDTLPKDFDSLKNWLADQQNQCLIDYWKENNWTKLRADSDLLIKVIDLECN